MAGNQPASSTHPVSSVAAYGVCTYVNNYYNTPGESGSLGRGKQEWLCEDNDLNDMYAHYEGKKEVTIWCFHKVASDQSRKRGRSSSPKPKKSPRVSQYEFHLERASKVKEFVKELEDKHKGTYSAEQLHTWANLIQMKKHSSLDDPPDYPFFRGHVKRISVGRSASTSDQSHSIQPERVPAVASPSKRLTMRSELIDQLGKCVTLMEKGALSDADYQELQRSIMTDIKNVSVQK